ncbi:MAG: SURF1 family cytochrome oxidase biogenesis protein, partial [bacterium]
EKQSSGRVDLPRPTNKNPPAGQLYMPQMGFTIGQTFIGNVSWPLVILYYDFEALSEAVEYRLAPAVLVLDSDHADGFIRTWQPSIIPASRHYGYAVQWWGLTLTLLIFGLIWRRNARTKN